MVKVLNNMIQGKGKVIAVAIAIALVTGGFLVMLTTINKIAIIIIAVVVAAIFICLALSIPSFIKKFRAEKNDVSAKTEEQFDVSGDDIDAGYGSGSGSASVNESEDEEDIEISTEKQEKIEAKLDAEVRKAQAETVMKNGMPEHIVLAVQVSKERSASQGSESQIQYRPDYMSLMKSLPDNMDLYGNPLPDQVICTENSHLVFESQKPKQDSYVPMESLPDNMDVLGNKLPYSPSTRINMNSSPEQCAQKLSAAEWLLKNEPWVLKQCPVKMPATTEDILNQRG